jgi:ubiquinone/menaquinone biosynthesis C-methylase UbiE
MTNAIEDQERKRREKDFHDKTFADETRNKALKFYTVVESSWRCYESILQSLCTGKTVLEYGCGPGSYAFFMAKLRAQVTGIDISVTAIDLANKRAADSGSTGTNFYVMDAERLGFRDSSFDLVCGRAILHHLDVDRSLSEIARVLRENGTAVVVEP